MLIEFSLRVPCSELRKKSYNIVDKIFGPLLPDDATEFFSEQTPHYYSETAVLHSTYMYQYSATFAIVAAASGSSAAATVKNIHKETLVSW